MREVQAYIFIFLGLIVFSIGLTGFLIPSDIVSGGIAGLATVIYFATDIPVGVLVLIINAFLVVLGIQQLGMGFGIKTIYSILVMSGLLYLFQQYITEPIVDDKFMAAIIGGILTGASVGMIFTQGGSTGGMDIIAMVINKYRNMSPGRIFLYSDVFIIGSSYLIFESLELIVYGYVSMGVFSYVVDLTLTGNKASMQLFIFSRKYEPIADMIIEKANRGVTVMDGTGWYSKENIKVLMVVIRKNESQHIFRMIKEMDPDAFISVASVMGVYGHGFDQLKLGKKK